MRPHGQQHTRLLCPRDSLGKNTGVDCHFFLHQGTLQHHISKASILQCSAFFMVQPSHPYMTSGKTIALTIRTFVGKVMLLTSVLSNIRQFISWATTVCWAGPSLLTPRSVKKPKASTVKRLSTVPWSPQIHKFKRPSLGLPGGPMVGNLPCNAEDTGQSLVWEDPTCSGATKPISHNHWSPCAKRACSTERKAATVRSPLHHNHTVSPARHN